jgi:hypothetical protein
VIWRWLLAAAGFDLAGLALLHATGSGEAFGIVDRAAVPGPWSGGFKALWLMYAAQLGVVAAYVLVAAARPRLAGESALWLCAVVAAADAVLLLRFVGPLPGTLLVAAASLLIGLAAAERARA